MIAADLARVADWPAICVLIAERVATDEILHSKVGHELNGGCVRGYCVPKYRLIYRVKFLERLL